MAGALGHQGLSGWEGKVRANAQQRVRSERKEQGRIPKPVIRILGRDLNKQVGVRNWE